MRVRASTLRSFAAAATALALAGGCGGVTGAPAVGGNDEVALVLGEGVPEPAARRLEAALSEEVRYARPEPLFKVERIPAARLDEVKNRKNIVILVNLTVPGRAAALARQLLSEEQFGSASRHHGSFFFLENPWVSGQTATIVAANDAQSVLSLIEERGERIRLSLVETTKTRLGYYLYREGEDLAAAAELMQAHGWSIRVPATQWRLDRERAADGLIRVEAGEPVRILTVYWAPAASVTLDAEGALALRDEIGRRFDEGDAVDRERTEASRAEFLGRGAITLKGAWKNEAKTIGGALESTLFVEGDRLYLIDRRAYAPAADLKIWMWQLEVMAETFRSAAGEAARSG